MSIGHDVVVKVEALIAVRPSSFRKQRKLYNLHLCVGQSAAIQHRPSDTLSWEGESTKTKVSWMAEVPVLSPSTESHSVPLEQDCCIVYAVDGSSKAEPRRTSPLRWIGEEVCCESSSGLVCVTWSLSVVTKQEILERMIDSLDRLIMNEFEGHFAAAPDSTQGTVTLFRDLIRLNKAAAAVYPSRLITRLCNATNTGLSPTDVRRACFKAAVRNGRVGVLLYHAIHLAPSSYLTQCAYMTTAVRQLICFILRHWFVQDTICEMLEAPISKETAYVPAAIRKIIREESTKIVEEETGYSLDELATWYDPIRTTILTPSGNTDNEDEKAFAETLPEEVASLLDLDLHADHVLSLCEDISSSLLCLTSAARQFITQYVRKFIGAETPFRVQDREFLKSITACPRQGSEPIEVVEEIQVIVPEGKLAQLQEAVMRDRQRRPRSIVSMLDCRGQC